MSVAQTLHHGISLREALRTARALGCSVRPLPGTGEVLVGPPQGGRTVRVNFRRKDTPRALFLLLKRAHGALGETR